MKLKLITSGRFYEEDDKVNLEKLGFKFKTTKEMYGKETIKKWYLEKDDDSPIYIEINSIEELMNFVREWGNVIISCDEIEIYDNYRE